MSSNTFLVALQEEGWKIGYRGLWSGGYPDKEIALGVAVRMASSSPDLTSKVVLQEADGSEVVFWSSE
jgi:hypothetical protein